MLVEAVFQVGIFKFKLRVGDVHVNLAVPVFPEEGFEGHACPAYRGTVTYRIIGIAEKSGSVSLDAYVGPNP